MLPLCDGPGSTGGLKFVYFPIGSVLEVVQAGPPNRKQAGPHRITLVRYQCPARLTATGRPAFVLRKPESPHVVQFEFSWEMLPGWLYFLVHESEHQSFFFFWPNPVVLFM